MMLQLDVRGGRDGGGCGASGRVGDAPVDSGGGGGSPVQMPPSLTLTVSPYSLHTLESLKTLSAVAAHLCLLLFMAEGLWGG